MPLDVEMSVVLQAPARVVPPRPFSTLHAALALIAGGLLPVQAAMNAQLARSLQSVPHAAVISYLIGSATLIGLLLCRRVGAPDWRGLRTAPRWSLLAGLLGAWYVTSSTLLIAHLGATLTLGLVVAGQSLAGQLLDHHGWLGVPRQRINLRGYAALGLFLTAMALLLQTR